MYTKSVIASHSICLAVLVSLFSLVSGAAEPLPGVDYHIKDLALARINPEVFGQFMERPSWGGEYGPESALAEDGKSLRPDVVALMRDMRFTCLRFPGGTDIDYTDWTDLIDQAPGRSAPRPMTRGYQGDLVSNRFGFHEYFTLRDALGCSTILVTNLRDAVYRKKNPREVALHAAGLVAYMNAPVGTKLPVGMPDWPSLRATNGQSKPFRAEYVQIGNETFWFWPPKPEDARSLGLESREEQTRWYIECVRATIAAIREVDATIKIIIDGPVHGLSPEICEDPYIRSQVSYLTHHAYYPMYVKYASNKQLDGLSARQTWETLVWGPGDFSEEGLNVGMRSFFEYGRKKGVKLACTEWNWNAWGYLRPETPDQVNLDFPSAIGAAGFIHGMLRAADVLQLATQSMLVGTTWGITAIRVPKTGPAFHLPQGHVFKFYAHYHGDEVLDLSHSSLPFFMKDAPRTPSQRIAYVDSLATADKDHLYFHAINRSYDQDAPLSITLPGSWGTAATATWHLLNGSPSARIHKDPITTEETRTPGLSGSTLKVVLPAHSVSVIVFDVKRPRP